MKLATRHPWPRWTLSSLLAMALGLAAPVGAGALPPPGGGMEIEKKGGGFDATGELRSGGRVLAVGGPLSCTKDGKVRIYVTVTQRKTGALARGTWRGTCTGSEQQWLLKNARTVGASRFRRGNVDACAAAVGHRDGQTDAVQWCGRVRLVPS